MTRFLLFLMLAAVQLSPALAIEVDLYTGEAVVGSQDAAERRKALPFALQNALVKLSGQRGVADDPATGAAVQNAASMLVSFHYRTVETLMPDGSQGDELRLVAQFTPTAVDEVARSLGLPLWQPDRKPTEIWVVVDAGGRREVMPVEFSYVRDTLDETAAQRGLPLYWPQPDEEGMYPVDMQLLWGGYTEDLASPQGDGVLILAARREGVEWNVRANLGFEEENWAWRLRNLDLQAALVEGLQLATDQVAVTSAIAASDLGTWMHELEVLGVRSADDYQRCLGHLQGIIIVEDIHVLDASAGRVRFRLDLSAAPQYLEQVLADGKVLQFDQDEQAFFMAGSKTSDR